MVSIQEGSRRASVSKNLVSYCLSPFEVIWKQHSTRENPVVLNVFAKKQYIHYTLKTRFGAVLI
jgi:hypothetical protein